MSLHSSDKNRRRETRGVKCEREGDFSLACPDSRPTCRGIAVIDELRIPKYGSNLQFARRYLHQRLLYQAVRRPDNQATGLPLEDLVRQRGLAACDLQLPAPVVRAS